MNDLPEAPPKWLCDECGKTCREYLTAPSPFDDDDEVVGCPHCKSVGSLTGACQIGDCTNTPTAGTPRGHGYRYVWTCPEHHPERPWL